MPFEKGKSGNPKTQWKKGQSGNPNGRRNSAKDMLNEILDIDINDRTRRELVLDKLVSMAQRGNLPAIKEVLDRTEGKSTEHVITEISKPLQVLDFDDAELDDEK
jgi:hypothetical protein